MRRRVFSAFLGAGLLGLALSMSSAQAGTILVFGQNGTANDFIATNNGNTGVNGGTDLSAVNIQVTITGIDAALSTPLTAYFNLTAASVTNAVTDSSGHDVQDFVGSFSITSMAGGGGTNYLSGTFTDVMTANTGTVFGNGTGLVFTATGNGLPTFTSDVIPDIYQPRAMSLSFTNVEPPVFLTGPGDTTLGAFTSNVSGNFSAVPEPASLALLGIGMVGLFACRRIRLFNRTAAA
jgi:PEP-CTERM motif